MPVAPTLPVTPVDTALDVASSRMMGHIFPAHGAPTSSAWTEAAAAANPAARTADVDDTPAYVAWFRQAARYIHAFRGRTFVLAFGGDLLRDGGFSGLAQDLNTLVSLGVRLVLVHGARPQIDARLAGHDIPRTLIHGVRLTERGHLGLVLQAVGALRAEIEAALSMSLPHSPMANANLRIAGGNFVTAQPMGVREGIDMQASGEVRKIDVAAIRHRLEFGETVLLSPLGYSLTGEIFNLVLEDVATATAMALGADKLIFLLDQEGVVDPEAGLLHELTAQQASRYLPTHPPENDIDFYLPCCIRAVREGVQRAHLISRRRNGGLIGELFTDRGVGTMISREPLETLRRATVDDIGGILQLFEPLEAAGILVQRDRQLLEHEIDSFTVLEHDRKIVACVGLKLYEPPRPGARKKRPTTAEISSLQPALPELAGRPAEIQAMPSMETSPPPRREKMAEMVGLAVASSARRTGRGERLLRDIERRAQQMGVEILFVLTTRTAHWFIERGFSPGTLDDLPARKRASYDAQRRSSILLKRLVPPTGVGTVAGVTDPSFRAG